MVAQRRRPSSIGDIRFGVPASRLVKLSRAKNLEESPCGGMGQERRGRFTIVHLSSAVGHTPCHLASWLCACRKHRRSRHLCGGGPAKPNLAGGPELGRGAPEDCAIGACRRRRAMVAYSPWTTTRSSSPRAT